MQETPEVMKRNLRIMVVDDELHVRNSIAPLLEMQGYQAESFADGIGALESFRRRGSDLVLSDVKMPGMDGVELLGRIRAVDPDIPVILMTAYADLDMAINAVKLGAYDFILKPFDPECLLVAVAKGLKYRCLCNLERDYNASLEKAVIEKAGELQELHNQMIISEKMAAIGLLSAGIAHEINNPVAFIASNLASLGKYATRMTDFVAWQADLIRSCCSPEMLKEFEARRSSAKIDRVAADLSLMVAESLEGVERIKKIVASLKSFSRKDDDVSVEADLNELVESTLTIVWNEIKYVATLNKELGDIPAIRCYPSQLNQVIMNLLVNAAHAIEKGPGTITVRTWADEDSVYLEVGDSGCGISAENMDRIFTPFFTTKEAGKGTGLGLSICLDIVARHNGDIKVESEVGKGTVFTVSLPRLTD